MTTDREACYMTAQDLGIAGNAKNLRNFLARIFNIFALKQRIYSYYLQYFVHVA